MRTSRPSGSRSRTDRGLGLPQQAPPALEVWGGAEYTCNRVGDRYFDQVDLSGHAQRPWDIARFASLGVTALRCGVLWERHAARDTDWQATDKYLGSVRAHGMRPILGLLHHGSGPRDTNLLDPNFAAKLADYAGLVASRYPWVNAYTPVNEPHTTARFAGQYGLWYPHHRTRASALKALLQQMKGVVLSMRTIRQVQPEAQLIQTEDLGRAWSSPEMSAMCDLYNERRWLTYDLLAGTVDQHHPLFGYLRASGIGEHEILWFAENPLPPDVVGINYYVTSDRFLDCPVARYGEQFRSAEGDFADLEAVRVRAAGIAGYESILREAYARYGLPVAITEVHLGDRVDEQIRWAVEAWDAALAARCAGVACTAVTFWALLGSYFWDSLVTEDNGHYEPGVFDLSAGEPRATALASVVRQLAQGKLPEHPALAEPGWWHRADRFHAQREIALDDALAV